MDTTGTNPYAFAPTVTTVPLQSPVSVCPHCGHCPHCGRGGHSTMLPWVLPNDSTQPWPPQFYVTVGSPSA